MFRQFTVHHDRCAMKVGTDGVLLGSWARVEGARRLLDIGCGCGLIALMLAQRSRGEVCAVEIESEAASQARENVCASPWAERIRVVREDIRTFADGQEYDVICSNPPYFTEALKCPDAGRTLARHTDTLDFDSLTGSAARLLSPRGEFSVVIPMEAAGAMKASAASALLWLSRETHVQTKPGAVPKRALLAFRPTPPPEPVVPQTLLIEQQPGVYSDAFRELVREFYLNLR